MLTTDMGRLDGYVENDSQAPQLGALAQYTIPPVVVTPTSFAVDPVLEIDTWFMVRPERLMVVHDGEPAVMSAVYLTALVCRSKATTLVPLIATCVTPLLVPVDLDDQLQFGGVEQRYRLPFRAAKALAPSVV